MADHPDAVLYCKRGRKWLGEALVTGVTSDGLSYIVEGWRGREPIQMWTAGVEGHLRIADCKPHPDPDRLLAEYVAWRLSQ